MSWHFSQALEAAYLQENFSDGAQSAPWKSIPSALDDSCSDKMKGTFHRSPFGMMYVPSTDDHGAALLTWFREDSLVPTLAQPERRQASMGNSVACGWKWPGSLAKYDPVSRGWKTRQTSFLEESTACLVTWPRWGLMLGGECLDQTQLAPIITEREPGYWPTPCHGSSRWGGTFQEVGGSLNKLRNTPTGKLYVNPDFWESLMGWPIGWTGIAPLETAKILEWRLKYGGF